MQRARPTRPAARSIRRRSYLCQGGGPRGGATATPAISGQLDRCHRALDEQGDGLIALLKRVQVLEAVTKMLAKGKTKSANIPSGRT